MPTLVATEWIAISVFVLGVLGFGLYLRGTITDAADLFLAGRSLPPWLQAFSTVATNLNANDFLGLAAVAYTFGIVAIGTPISNMVAVVLVTLVVIPFLRRLRVFSMGEWFNDRFNRPVGDAYDLIWTFIWMFVNMGLYIYAGALVLNTLLGWPLWISIALVVVVGTTYTLLGGFGAVAGSDGVQFILMFVPLVLLVPISLTMVGGFSNLLEGLKDFQSTMLPANNPLGADLPLVGSPLNAVLLYLGFISLSVAYWGSEAQILQRPLAARDERSAQLGYLYTAIWYALVVPVVILIPGLVAAVLFPNLETPDEAMPRLLAQALPPGLLGAAIVGLLAAVLSSVDSQLNAFQTFFTQRVYRRYFRPSEAEGHYVRVGRTVGAIFMVLTIGMAYVFSLQPLMFIFAVSILATIMPTFATVALLGGLWDRVTTKAALIGVVFGLVFSIILAFTLGHEAVYPRALYTILSTTIVIVVASLLTSPNEGEVPTGFLRAVRENLDETVSPQVRRVSVTVIVIGALMFAGFVLVFDVLGGV
jgi:solute:Na+ symporter, SSS family